MGTSKDRPTTLENSPLDVTKKLDQSLAATLQDSIIRKAGEGATGSGSVIEKLMPLARSANTWRTKNTLWKKWLDFAKADKIDPLYGSEACLRRYLGWLYEDNSVSGRSVRQYLSAVTTSHVRIGIELSLSPLVQLAVAAYKQADLDRK